MEYDWSDANVEGDLAKGGVTWRSDSGLQVSETSSRGREFQRVGQWAEDWAEVLLGLAEGDSARSGKQSAEAEQTHEGAHSLPGAASVLRAREASQETASVFIMQQSGACIPHCRGTPSLKLLTELLKILL